MSKVAFLRPVPEVEQLAQNAEELFVLPVDDFNPYIIPFIPYQMPLEKNVICRHIFTGHGIKYTNGPKLRRETEHRMCQPGMSVIGKVCSLRTRERRSFCSGIRIEIHPFQHIANLQAGARRQLLGQQKINLSERDVHGQTHGPVPLIFPIR